MNKVIAINLGGNAYQLEEGGYDALRAYLENATSSLQGNPDREEILSDIERAIAEKFRALLANHKTVVEAKEVTTVLAEMGPIEADAAESGKSGPDSASDASQSGAAKKEEAPRQGGTARRLYRIHDGAMVAGVCNGIGGYLNIDPTFVRLAFVFLTLFWGTGLLAYFVLAIVVPEAQSPEEKAAASGDPLTAQEFIRRAKEGYYSAMKGFPDRKTQREWKRRFKREMRASADQWQFNWHSYWAGHAPFHPVAGIGLPLLSLLHGMLTILWICALISLLATGAILGVPLPADVPVWVAALLLILVYGLVSAPLKVAKRACYWGMGRPNLTWPFVFALDAVVGLAVAAILLWLAAHYFPELRQALQSVPSLIHQAADDLRTWWHNK